MKYLPPVCIALASVAILATSASAEGHDQVVGNGAAGVTELKAQEAAVSGDWAKVAELAGKAYRQSPSLNNEFNLATAYTHTGQIALAIPLYADVAENGQRVQVTALYDYRRPGARPPRVSFNMADEANRRLELLTGQPAARSGTQLASMTTVR